MATPELTADLQLPASLDVLGQQVDLAPLQVRGGGCLQRAGFGYRGLGALQVHCRRFQGGLVAACVHRDSRDEGTCRRAAVELPP